MLWIGICEAAIGGLLGGCLVAIAMRETNKFNMKMMEKQWESDYVYFRSRLEKVEHQISTLSVDKPVNNHVNKYRNKGPNHTRHFNQRG
jgi:hypothetical protein